ncbi:MAG: cation diffusion facilitator family transporter [Armatimonadota bacterium]
MEQTVAAAHGPPLRVRAAGLAAATSVAILALKLGAYVLTGSVALLSDAAESVVNVVAANITLISLLVAVRPPDEGHQYGHAKAEYVSSATEAALIAIAGAGVIVTAVNRLLHPQPLTRIPLGLVLLVVATGTNLAVALYLLRISRARNSVALEASAKHLLADVITSAGVFVGVGLVALTGWGPLDPITATLVGGHILWMGGSLLRRSLGGLLDERLPPDEEARVRRVFDEHRSDIIDYHAMRTRRAGPDRFIDLHLVLHRKTTVGEAHDLTDHLEEHLKEALPGVDVTIHVEPCEAACRRCAQTSA